MIRSVMRDDVRKPQETVAALENEMQSDDQVCAASSNECREAVKATTTSSGKSSETTRVSTTTMMMMSDRLWTGLDADRMQRCSKRWRVRKSVSG